MIHITDGVASTATYTHHLYYVCGSIFNWSEDIKYAIVHRK